MRYSFSVILRTSSSTLCTLHTSIKLKSAGMALMLALRTLILSLIKIAHTTSIYNYNQNKYAQFVAVSLHTILESGHSVHVVPTVH